MRDTICITGKKGENMTHVAAVRDLRNNFADIKKLLKRGDKVIITDNGKEVFFLANYDELQDFEGFQNEQYHKRHLEIAKERLNNPDTKWLDAKNELGKLNEKYGL